MLTTEEIKAILPDITEMFVSCVEEVLKSSEEDYIEAQEFCELMDIASSATFSKWKKEGRFDKAMHPATIGGNRVKYNRWFNVYKQRTEPPDQNRQLIERPKLTTKMLMPKDIKTILPQIMKTAVKVVEMIKNPKSLGGC